MKKYSLPAAFILFFLSFEIPAFSQRGAIKGTVLGSEGPLQSATVSTESASVLTDNNGKFSFTLQPGSVKLTITHAGYKKIEQEVIIENGVNKFLSFTLEPNVELGEVTVIGSRSINKKSNLSSLVPIDILLSSQLLKSGQTNLVQMLNYSAPSFNASRQMVNETVTLRGLDPDQMLILINGSRYHSMAYINDGKIRGTLGRGAVANDINSIPFAAIEKIEILRDGATAQYGSDAIAGVINIILKKSTGKTFAQINAGQYYNGDGENYGFKYNHGIALGKRKEGSLNFSADFNYRNPTSRGGKYTGTVYYNNPVLDDSMIHARNFSRGGVSNAGTTKLVNGGISMNGNFPIGNKTELFWTGIANSRQNLFTGGYIFPKNSKQVNPDLYPDGFKPRTKQNVMDLSAIAGIRGETKNKWRWEYCSSYGKNADKYFAENTNNASQYFLMGPNAPTGFYTGTARFQQLSNDLNFTRSFVMDKHHNVRSVNLAFGAEWRFENYKIDAGEEGAWSNYDPFNIKQGNSQNGLIFRPENEVNKNRNVLGTYIDVESGIGNNLLIDVASRFENYSDYGSNLAGKLSARYKISDLLSLRASMGNGFRAPALQQRYFSNTAKGPVNSGTTLTTVLSGIFSNNSEIAKAFDIPQLTAERSLNLSGGFITNPFDHFIITVDVYWIRITNRIVLSGKFDKASNPEVKKILANYPDIDQVQFFTNAINTKTKGFDIVLSNSWKIKKATLSLNLAANFTQTKLFGNIKVSDKLPDDSLNSNTLFNREERTRIEKGQPHDKIILLFNYKTGKLEFQARNTRFGKTSITFDSRDVSRDEFFSPKILTDLSITYSPKKWLGITAGANNILNVYPSHLVNPLNTGEGTLIYAQEASPFGYNGGYYFLNMEFRF